MLFNLISFIFLSLSFKPIYSSNDPPTCSQIVENLRFDCFPEPNAYETECVRRGCCWQSNVSPGVPYCYYSASIPGYNVEEINELNSTSKYTLVKTGATIRPNEIQRLEARIIPETYQRLRVQIVDPNNPNRFQVPLSVDNKFLNGKTKQDDDYYDYQVFVSENPFSIKVYRKSTRKLLFDTSVAPLIYADQYIQFSTTLPNDNFYGIGEHQDTFAHSTSWKTYSLWNRDVPPEPNRNLYGSFPFYLSVEDDSNAFGFFFLNSNAMDVNVQPAPALTFITIGGIIDFYLYMGPTPQDVIRQHTEVIGRSMFPQYFTLGFHLCRYNVGNSTNLKKVINRNRKAHIPYDTHWTDIDAMLELKDWTFDPNTFHDLVEIVADLHEHGQRYINIIDPAISNSPGYLPYEDGLKSNVFIKNEENDEPLVGKVWPGTTVFPDFTNPNTTNWWIKSASTFHQTIPFDGLWIDMNEPSNFVDGSINGCSNSVYNNPPYTPRILDGSLSAKTICPSSREYLSNHYNLHNMYGHFEAIASYKALQAIEPNKRPFVLTRASFSGTGHYAAHWSGDNQASWNDLYYSIPNMLNFNMFGISSVGSDVCGFRDDTTEELCIRWMQLGSFYPFMRNHNDFESKDQDPAVFSYGAQQIMKKYLNIRYKLLPYLYTLFYQSTSFGDTVVRPLIFEFPTDKNALKIDRQFMFGPALLISPVLEQGATKINAYFPSSQTWYDFETGEAVDTTQSSSINLDAPLDVLNIHVRSGYIIPYQFPSLTTTASRKNPFGLIVALMKNNSIESNGKLFWDDGESANSIKDEQFNLIYFTAGQGYVNIAAVNLGQSQLRMILSKVEIFGLDTKPTKVLINNQSFDNFFYDEYNMVLTIQYFSLNMLSSKINSITWF